ncbi:HEAT repeat domain-containing protein [Pyxidicoccus sp. MSG2]|uniref:HEAT repeat domain-containing protein n=1 Tax=Pyxidicoccus sp. MSG2 TaxID=2996790 RepID=UPI00226E06EC|nr:HEAT repeat domain-containing protein [Pyxidicoccus sp. MSG2]MCY1019251.1 HEAT repeat domain-containing protein [Pyxidicoccus sp. MSG2]
MTRHLLASLVGLCAASLLACTNAPGQEAPAAPTGGAPERPSGEDGSKGPPTAYAPRPATRTRYALEWESTTRLAGLEGTDAAPTAASGRVRARGNLSLGVRSVTASSVTLRATLDLVELEVVSLDATLPPEAGAALRALLARPFELEVAPDGALRALRMEAAARDEPLVVGLVTAVSRFSRPALPPAATREASVEEEDLTGTYRARYAFRDGRLRKSRTAYSRLYAMPSSTDGKEGSGSSVTGEGVYTLDAWGDVLDARLEEELVLTAGASGAEGIRTTSTTTASLRRIEGAAPPAASPEAEPPLVPLAFEAIALATFARGAESYTPPPTVESALLRLGVLRDAPPLDRDRLRSVVLRELVRALRARPEAAEALRAFVVEHGAQEIIDVVALSALRTVGDDACQRALVKLLEQARRLPEPAARLAIIQAGGLREPSPAIATALGNLARTGEDALARGAALGLGRVAGHVPRERAKPLVDALVAFARQAPNDDIRGTYLAALGNARTDRADVLALLDSAVGSRDPRVRARGVDAFRLVPGGRADVVLAQRIRKDRDPNVRTAAVVASRARAMEEYLSLYEEVLANDPEPAVRRAVVEALTAAPPEARGSRALLEQAARGDADDNVRELARRALTASAGSGPP